MNFPVGTSVLLILSFAVTSVFAEPVPQLVSDTELSTAGYFHLSWKNTSNGSPQYGHFILQEADDQTFTQARTLYSGPDTASLISGRTNGIYYYRVGASQDQAEPIWSNTETVEVSHHPLSRALLFFSLGTIVFLITLTTVLLGNRAHR